MADRSIIELNEATQLLDEGLTVVYQNDQTQKIAGSALKAYARAAVNPAVTQAQTAATNAEQSAQSAGTSATAAQNANAAAQTAATEAQAAQSAIENLTVAAETLAQGQPATVTKSIISGVVNLLFGLPQGESAPVITGITYDSDYHLIFTLSNGQTFDAGYGRGESGAGTGDMIKSVYDSTNAVATAGGIIAYVSSVLANYVPTTRTINTKALTDNITLTASDVGARPDTWMPTAADVGAVPTSRTVNGKPLSSNIVLNASDVGADALGTAAGLINRTTAVNAADANYTTYMARGSALFGAETNPTVNGTIAWQYE